MARLQKDTEILKAAVSIAQSQPFGDELAFVHSVLCQIGLPRSRVAEREFHRRQGAAWLVLQAGHIDFGAGPIAQPLPYGSWPRLILAWLTTYAVRHATRVIPVGSSAAEFLSYLGKTANGGERGTYKALGIQMPALASCRLQMGSIGRTFGDQPVEQFDAWMPNQLRIWPGELTLSEKYFREIHGVAVPLDQRAIGALSGSALALDVYAWLAYRLLRVPKSGQPISWYQLSLQFGQEYQGKRPMNDFQKRFKLALRDALAVYPNAKVEVSRGGLLLRNSLPPVHKRTFQPSYQRRIGPHPLPRTDAESVLKA